MSDLNKVKHRRGNKTLTAEIYRHINNAKNNSVFFTSDFVHLGDRDVVRKIFEKFRQEGLIERLAPGMFYKPYVSKFGIVPIPLDTVAKAIAKRDQVSIMLTGNTALNILGLSTQVPANAVYFTSGSARTIKVGNRKIRFMRRVPKNFAGKGTLMPLVIQALRTLGKENVDDETISGLWNILSKHQDKDKYLVEDMALAPKWIQKIIKPMIKNETLAKIQ